MEAASRILTGLAVKIGGLRLEQERLKGYLMDQFRRGEWHGVRDAAADLERIDAEIDGIDCALDIVRLEKGDRT